MPGDDADAQQRITELENRVQELEQRLEAQPAPDTVKWLVGQVQGAQQEAVPQEEMTTVERYAQMPMDERVASLPASEMRATLLFENWGEWARRGPYGDEFITTAQEKPATLRMLLRERDPTVEVDAGQDLHWQQVYRTMRALHRLTGGAIEYDEQHQTPDATDSGTCHALVLEAPGAMPTLPR